jgi:hypothetical protein
MVLRKILVDGKNFPIQPSQINVDKYLSHAFKNCYTDASAHHVIKLCQKLGGWFPFNYLDIEEIYNEAGHHRFSFNHLIGQGIILLNAADVLAGKKTTTKLVDYYDWIVFGDDEKYHVTENFVKRCFKYSQIIAKSSRKH